MENERMEKPGAEAEGDLSAQRPDYQEQIIHIIRGNASPKMMRDELSDFHENDIAEVIPRLTPAERRKLYHILNTAALSDIFEYMEEDQVADCLGEMDLKKAAGILSEMESDAAVVVLREIDKDRRALLIELLDEESRKDIRLLASFDEDEIGSKMTTNYIVIRENISAEGSKPLF